MEFFYEGKKDLSKIEDAISAIRSQKKAIKSEKKEGLFIHGDNFEIMARLLDQYENKIDLIYIDPPFNTSGVFFYDPNRTATISYSKTDNLAYSDNLSFEAYLEFIRERLVLMRKLLSDSGTLYFHIDTKVGHYIKIVLDEIFGFENYLNDITRIKSNPKNFSRRAYGNQKDVIYVYAKNAKKNIFNDVLAPLSDEDKERLFKKVDQNGKRYTTVPCHAPGETQSGPTGKKWRDLAPPKGRHWRCAPDELDILDQKGLIEWSKTGNPRIKKYADDAKGKKIQDVWESFKDPPYPTYPTQKNSNMLDLIIQQSSNENSIVMDCFCGSGSFLKSGLKYNRFVIGIDKSEMSFECIKKDLQLSSIDIKDI